MYKKFKFYYLLRCFIGFVFLFSFAQRVIGLTLNINSGADYTNYKYTTLTIGNIPSDAQWMIFSNNNSSWSPWEGISSIKYSWDLTAYGGGSGDGNKTVYMKVFVTTYSPTDIGSTNDSITLDTYSPSTTCNLSGTFGENGWYKSDVTVTLNAYDVTSGVNKTLYLVDGDLSAQTYTTPFAIGANGEHTVYYWSYDNTGNGEATHSQTVKIDKTVPSGLSVLITSPGTGFTNNRIITLALLASDATSGVAKMQFTEDSNNWPSTWEDYSISKSYYINSTGEGAKTIYFRVKDYAGNISSFVSTSIILDETKPTVVSFNPPDQNQGENETITINVTVSDTIQLEKIVVIPEIGPAKEQYVNGTNDTKSFDNINLRQGINHIMIQVWDVAGNVSNIKDVYYTYGVYKTTNFKFHFRAYTISNPDVNQVNSAGWQSHNGIPDYVYNFGQYFEYSWNQIVKPGSYGYESPPSEYFVIENKLPVYILNLGNGAYGSTAYKHPILGSIIQVDNDYIGDKFYTHGTDAMQITSAHEFFHAVKCSYNPRDDNYWWNEATSVWMEDEIYPNVNDYLQYLKGFAGKPSWFANSTQSLDYINDWNEYGSCIFAKYFSERFNEKDIIRQIWDICKTTDSLSAIDSELISGHGTSLSNEFKTFTVWNYDASKYYIEGNSYPKITVLDTSAKYQYPSGVNTVMHLASHYFEFRPAPDKPTPQTLLLNFDSSVVTPLWGGKVLKVKMDGTIEEQNDLNKTGNTVSISNFDTTCSKVIVIPSNTDAFANNLDYSLIAMIPPNFTVEYFADSNLTQPLATYTGKPITKAQTIYLKITASEQLSANPTFSIDAPGTVNDKTEVATILVSGNVYKGEVNIVSGPGVEGMVSVTISGKDIGENIATNVTPTIGKEFMIDVTPPIGSLLIRDTFAPLENFTGSQQVSLYSTVSDNSEVGWMQFSYDGIIFIGDWIEYTHIYSPWWLTAGAGNKTVWARYKDKAGNISIVEIKDEIYLDTTDPEMPSGPAKAPRFAGGAYSSSTTVTFTWEGDFATDMESGISNFNIAIYNSITDSLIAQADVPNSQTNYTVDGLIHGQSYFAKVRAQNGAGRWSAWLTGGSVMIDTTSPMCVSINDGLYTNNNTQLSCNWSFTEDISGIVEYQYAIGTSQYPNTGWYNIIALTSTGTLSNITRTFDSPLDDGIYYFTVKAKNGAGSETPVSSDGIIVDTTPPDKPQSLSVSPSGWTNQTQFTISWSTPSDLSGIAGAYYKLNTEPANYIPNTQTFTSNFSVVEGNNILYIWLKDNAGNTDYTKNATVTLRYDITPPDITSYSCLAFSPNGDGIKEATTIDYTLSDNFSTVIKTTIKIYDLQNNLVRTLIDSISKNIGANLDIWDGKNTNGVVVAEGIYKCKITAVDEAENLKVYEGDIIVDITPPQVSNGSIYINPGAYSHNIFTKNDKSVDISFDIFDRFSPSAKVSFTFTSGTRLFTKVTDFVVTPNITQNLLYAWDGTDALGNTASDGEYTLGLKATDESGNIGNTIPILQTFKIDRTPSFVTTLYTNIQIFNPELKNDTVTAYYKISDNATVEVAVEDILGQIVRSPISEVKQKDVLYSYTWDGKKQDNSFASDGSYVIKIKTTDEVGNKAEETVNVIKNQIPAQIVSPVFNGIVGNQVEIVGIAIDPVVNDNIDFLCYKVWYATYSNATPDNYISPDMNVWKSIPVPVSNQSPNDVNYPNSNASYRAILNSTLAYWDVSSLPNGTYTILLVAQDSAMPSNYSAITVSVKVDNTIPETDKPILNITAPISDQVFNITTINDKLNISYTLMQNTGKKSNVVLDIFKMVDVNTFGPVILHSEYFNKTAGETIQWDGKDFRKQYVQNGIYRIQLTAVDIDGLGMDKKSVSVNVNVTITEPLKITKFESDKSDVLLNEPVQITYELTKAATVYITIYDTVGNLVKMVDNEFTSGLTEYTTVWSSIVEGLYTCKIDVIAVDDQTKGSASVSIAVIGGPGSGLAEITSPAPYSVNQGSSNFNWSATVKKGEYYSPQSFSATVQTHAAQSWIQTSQQDFGQGGISNIDLNSESGNVKICTKKYDDISTFYNGQKTPTLIIADNKVQFSQYVVDAIHEQYDDISGNYPLAPSSSWTNANDRNDSTLVWPAWAGYGNTWAFVCGRSGPPQGVPPIYPWHYKFYRLRVVGSVAVWHKDGNNCGANIYLQYGNSSNGPWTTYKYWSQVVSHGSSINISFDEEVPTPFYAPYFKILVQPHNSNHGAYLFLNSIEGYQKRYENTGVFISQEHDTYSYSPIWNLFQTSDENNVGYLGGAHITYRIASYNSSGENINWEAAPIVENGVVPSLGQKRYFKWRADFATRDLQTTPVIYNVTQNFGLVGTLISQAHDCKTAPSSWRNFEVSEYKPSGTNITYTTQTSDDGYSWESERTATPGQPIYSTPRKYIRWKATLSTNDGSKTPVLREVKINANYEPSVTVNNTCYNGHDTYNSIEEIRIPYDYIPSSSPYTFVTQTNPKVLKTIVEERGLLELKATTNEKESWDMTTDDQGLPEHKIISKNNEFNNSGNNLQADFVIEGPFEPTVADRYRPITISAAYPLVNMNNPDEIKNKYTFWKQNGTTIDNPYVWIDADNYDTQKQWDIKLQYPDGTMCNDLVVDKKLTKASNTDSNDINDDFTVKISTDEAAPKRFVEIKGSAFGSDFKGYSMFYQKTGDTILKTIPVISTQPVSNNTLSFWDVSGLNGEYKIKLYVFAGNGVKEIEQTVYVGKQVFPGEHKYVSAPWNKAYLEFYTDSLLQPTTVSITPVKLSDTDIIVDTGMPLPLGALFDMEPKDIQFNKDGNGKLVAPAVLTVRFLPEEVTNVDIGKLTAYHVDSNGKVKPTTLTSLGWKKDASGKNDIFEVSCEVVGFSQYLIIPQVPIPEFDANISTITNQQYITITGVVEAVADVTVYNDGASLKTVKADSNGRFSAEISLSEGANPIFAKTTRWFNNIPFDSPKSKITSITRDTTLPQITNLSVSAAVISPDGARIKSEISFVLSKESVINVEIYNNDVLTRALISNLAVPAGNYSCEWDGKNTIGQNVSSGTYTCKVNIIDLAGNASSATTEFEVMSDTTPPIMTNVASSDITWNSAVINWLTNEPSDSQVEYGLTTSYGNSSVLDTVKVTNHSVNITGLTSGTVYHYRVKSKDTAGNLATSEDNSFTSDINFISNHSFELGTSSWTFYTEEAGSFVTTSPGFDGSKSARCTIIKSTGNLQLYQKDIVLNPNTRYRLTFTAYSNTGRDMTLHVFKHGTPYTNYGLSNYLANLTTTWQTFSTEFVTTGFSSVVTDARLMFWYAPYAVAGDVYYVDDVHLETVPPDTTPPIIVSVTSCDITWNSALVNWITNEPSDSQVEYGLTTSYGNSTVLSTVKLTNHSANITGLMPGTVYHYRVSSRDESGNFSTSEDNTFTSDINFISNHSFESGTTSWAFYTEEAGSFVTTSPGFEGSKSARCTITKSTGNIQLYQTGICLNPNTRYKLTFTAYSNTGHDMTVRVFKHGTPYTNYGLDNYLANLTTSWQTYSTEFVTTGFSSVVTDARLMLWYAPYAAAGDVYYVDDIHLETVPPDTTPPIITSVTSSNITWNSAVINWLTNEPSDSQVEYSTTTLYGISTTSDTTKVTSHSVNITGLTLGTTYYYHVTSKDGSGNIATSENYTFSTLSTSSGTNHVINAGFESGTDSWAYYAGGGGTFISTTPGFEGAKSAKCTITAANGNIQLYQTGICLNPNTRYRLIFTAYSPTRHAVTVHLLKHGTPYTDYGLNYTANLGTSWQTFTTEFITTGFTAPVTDGRFRFWFTPYATAGDTYYIDDVRLETVTGLATPPKPIIKYSNTLKSYYYEDGPTLDTASLDPAITVSSLKFKAQVYNTNDNNPTTDYSGTLTLSTKNSKTGILNVADAILTKEDTGEREISIPFNSEIETVSVTGDSMLPTLTNINDMYLAKPIGNNGGMIKGVNKLKIIVSENVLTETRNLAVIKTKTPAVVRNAARYVDTVKPISYDFGRLSFTNKTSVLEEDIFTKPISITIPYTLVDIGELKEEGLRIYSWNGREWELVPGVHIVDKLNKTITANVKRFTTYRILGSYLATDLSNVKVYPNPYKPNMAVGGKLKVINLPINSEMKIYTVSGELARELKEADFGNLGWLEWDGKNDDGDKVARGVYIYQIRDATGRKKTGKVGLIK
ncbi:MAG: carbohydrate binding domain-containing protein [Elusimicrobia bacterium]|nr:carbohydrate binding domain-containing protein [Elusimicrobiota bacterium]